MRRPVTLSVTVPALVAGSILATLVPAASGAGPGSPPARADALRRANVQLTSRSHSIVLELYGLDSQLASAQARLAGLTARAAEVRRQRATIGVGERIARRASRASERALGNRLRVLYEAGDSDPLAILLGSTSLDEAITQLDDQQALADQDRAVIEQTRETNGRLKQLARSLAARQAELSELESDAAATVGRLAAARSARSSYLTQIASERRLNAGRISTLEAEAQAAQSKALEVAATVAAAPSVAVTTAAPVTQAGGALTVTATGYALSGTTATGVPVGPGVVAVDPSVIPLGTRMTIPGYGEGVAADVGIGVRGAMIDLWFPTTEQALAWGRRSVTITLH